MLHHDRGRATSFGANPDLYHRSRPSYPDALMDDLVLDGALDVLDVGCGTGITSLRFAARGCRVLGVEADERMASYARSLGCQVHTATFEEWDPEGSRFDLVASGQAWHWVDPDRGAHKAAQVLRPGGRIGLFWNRARHPEDIQAAFESIYHRVAPGLEGYSIVLGHGTGDRFDLAAGGLAGSGAFSAVDRRSYPWDMTYATAQWLDHLITHSDHQQLPEPVRGDLLTAIGQAIDEMGGSFTTTYETVLITARRRPSRS